MSSECKEKSEIKDIITSIPATSKLSCQEINVLGVKYFMCEMQLAENNYELISFRMFIQYN